MTMLLPTSLSMCGYTDGCWGHRLQRVVHSKLAAAVGQDVDEDDPTLQRPDDDEVARTTNATREALEKIVAGKIKAALPKQQVAKREEAQFIRYTPQQQGDGHNAGASNRIIRMVEMPKDPLDPPKFRHKRIAKGIRPRVRPALIRGTHTDAHTHTHTHTDAHVHIHMHTLTPTHTAHVGWSVGFSVRHLSLSLTHVPVAVA
jgi:hypothetical protein